MKTIKSAVVTVENMVIRGENKGSVKGGFSFKYPTYSEAVSISDINGKVKASVDGKTLYESTEGKKRRYTLKFSTDFDKAINDIYDNGGYEALLSTDENVQYALHNFLVFMTLYIRKHRIAFANAPKQEVLEQDIDDVLLSSYVKVREGLIDYKHGGKDIIREQLNIRFRRVVFKENKAVLETMTKDEQKALVQAKATEMIDGFNLDEFGTFKYLCACIVGQVYDAYLFRIGREVAFDTTDVICAEDGAEIGTLVAILAKKALQYARDVNNDEQVLNFLNINIQKVDIYFENNPSDLEKFTEIKTQALQRFALEDDKTKVRLNRLVDDAQKRFLYRLRDRINLFYANIENTDDDAETKANARRLTRREQYAKKQQAKALHRAKQFKALIQEYNEELDITERFTSEFALLQKDIRVHHNRNAHVRMIARQSVYTVREAGRDE